MNQLKQNKNRKNRRRIEKRRRAKKIEEEQKLEEKKKLEEKNKINTAIGAATAAAGITNRNNNRNEVKRQKTAEEKRPEATQPKVSSRPVPSKEPQVNSNVREVYITPTGKRYHYDPQCGGKNSYKVGINNVKGRTPCQKCVH